MARPIRFFEFFAGMGCIRAALKSFGGRFKTIGISEIDPRKLEIYRILHGDIKNYGDITKIEDLPPCDVWHFSSPCQDLSSTSSTRTGLKGSRSGLAFEIVRLAKKHHPEILICENVIDFLRSGIENDFFYMFQNLGYHVRGVMLSPTEFGAAQSRNRWFFVFSLREKELIVPLTPLSRGHVYEQIYGTSFCPPLDLSRFVLFRKRLARKIGTKRFDDYIAYLGSPCLRRANNYIYDGIGAFPMNNRELMLLQGFSVDDWTKIKELPRCQISEAVGDGVHVGVYRRLIEGLDASGYFGGDGFKIAGRVKKGIRIPAKQLNFDFPDFAEEG